MGHPMRALHYADVANALAIKFLKGLIDQLDGRDYKEHPAILGATLCRYGARDQRLPGSGRRLHHNPTHAAFNRVPNADNGIPLVGAQPATVRRVQSYLRAAEAAHGNTDGLSNDSTSS